MVAAKLTRMFSRPFVCALNAHTDAVRAIAAHPMQPSVALSGAQDGSLAFWHIPSRAAFATAPAAHAGAVSGVVCTPDGAHALSCGADAFVHLWALPRDKAIVARPQFARWGSDEGARPSHSWTASGHLSSVSHAAADAVFATAGAVVELWSMTRPTPTQRISFPAEAAVSRVAFHPSPAAGWLLVATAGDRQVVVIDTRMGTAALRWASPTVSNAAAFNPQLPHLLATACDDYAAYVFDIRRIDPPERAGGGPRRAPSAVAALVGHVAAALDVAWCPAGRRLATASADRTVRVWDYAGADPRVLRAGGSEVLHGARMGRVGAVAWAADARFVLCGSDDANLRVWRATPDAPVRPLSVRERRAIDTRAALVRRHGAVPEVANIMRQRRIPQAIRRLAAAGAAERRARRRRLLNRLRYAPSEAARRRVRAPNVGRDAVVEVGD